MDVKEGEALAGYPSEGSNGKRLANVTHCPSPVAVRRPCIAFSVLPLMHRPRPSTRGGSTGQYGGTSGGGGQYASDYSSGGGGGGSRAVVSRPRYSKKWQLSEHVDPSR